MECPVVLFLRRVAVERFEKGHGELRSVRPVVERLPCVRFRRRWRCAFQVRREIDVVGRRHLQITRQAVEDPGHVGRALDVRVAAKGVDAATGPADVAEQQLQHRRGLDDLRAGGVLGPADGVDNRRRLLHVAVLADRREQIGGFQELILGDPRDALDHLRRVARIVLLEELEDGAWVLQRRVERDGCRQ